LKKALLAIGLVVVATSFLPAAAGGQAATEDSVTGFVATEPQECTPIPGGPPGAEFCPAPTGYLFDVHSGPSGQSPSGTVLFTTGERASARQDHGTVTCLAVLGNRATIGVNFAGLVDAFTGQPIGDPHSAVIYVEANGGNGQDRIRVQDLASAGSAPATCPAPTTTGLGPTYAYKQGPPSLAITDAQPPLPTSKDQCKDGGWRNFTGFKNQGQCVAFVERGPRH
jgi:hypothetical protein